MSPSYSPGSGNTSCEKCGVPWGQRKQGQSSWLLQENKSGGPASVLCHPPGWAQELGEVVTLTNACFASMSREGDHPAGCHLPSGQSHTHTVCPLGAWLIITLLLRLAGLGKRRQESTAWLQIRPGKPERHHTPLAVLCVLGVSPLLI